MGELGYGLEPAPEWVGDVERRLGSRRLRRSGVDCCQSMWGVRCGVDGRAADPATGPAAVGVAGVAAGGVADRVGY